MDTLSHGLWGGAAFGQKDSRQWKWAFFLGMAPDLFSFGPFFLTHLGDIGKRWKKHSMGIHHPPMVPAYVHHAYNVTHSLVTFAVLMTLALIFFGRRGWPMAAWGLHILCDIPTHSTRFFPTPYLWPFHTPFVNGTPWARPRFMLANYSLLAVTYLGLAIWKKTRRSSNEREGTPRGD